VSGASKIGLIVGDVVNISATGVFADKNAGQIKSVNLTSSYSGADVDNYTIISQTSAPAAIDKASLTVTANNETPTYNATAYSGGNGVVYQGFRNSETTSVLSGALTYTGNSQGAMNADTYVLTPQGLTSNNYTIAFVNGALTIQPVVLTASLTGAISKVYDGNNAAALSTANYAVSGWVGTDAATITRTHGTYSDNNVGLNKPVTVGLVASDFTATGTTRLSNYSLPSVAIGSVGSITPVALIGTLIGQVSKVQDGSTSATLNANNYMLLGWVGSDGASVTRSSGTYADSNVGTAKLVTVNLRASDFVPGGNTRLTNYALPTSLSGPVGVITAPPPQPPAPDSDQAPTTPPTTPPTTSPTTSPTTPPATPPTTPGVNSSVTAVYVQIPIPVTAPAAPVTEVKIDTSTARVVNLGLETPGSTLVANDAERVEVELSQTPSSKNDGLINVWVPMGMVMSGTEVTIPLAEQFQDRTSSSDLIVLMLNGEPLPDWLRYNASLKALVAKAIPVNALPMKLMVMAGGSRYVLEIRGLTRNVNEALSSPMTGS
jgi:hypothetical protein